MVRLNEKQRPSAAVVPQSKSERLLAHLHRGGVYAHLWTDAGNRSHWFRVDAPARSRRVPKGWLRHNVYFTVHPLSQIPPHNASGNPDKRYISSQLPYIAAVNALFAEYDGKDFVSVGEAQPHLPENFPNLSESDQRAARKEAQETAFYAEPARYKNRAWSVIEGLTFPPSVIIDSGGGYHAYWLLRQTLPVDESNRADIQAVQHAWVQMVQADPGAADLRRMLRVPGTYNVKEGFGEIAPRVLFVKADFEQLYAYSTLEEAVNDWLFAQRLPVVNPPVQHRQYSALRDEQRATFNREHSLVALLTQHGYQITYQSKTLTRLSRPGRDKSHSSVTVFPAREDGAPELSVHFSSNDPLYSQEYIDPTTSQVRRRAHDAYSVFLQLQNQTSNASRISATD